MIGEIENAIIARIKAVQDSDALGYKLEAIKSYAGEASDDPKRATRDFPAIWIIYKQSTKVSSHPTFINYTAEFFIVCAAKSLRNERASRYGGDGEVGAAQIAEDCASILHGYSPDIEDIKIMSAANIDPLFADASDKGLASVYALDVSVPYTFKPTKFDIDGGQPLGAIHTNWDLPPNGEVGATLPDDENADATSHVTGA